MATKSTIKPRCNQYSRCLPCFNLHIPALGLKYMDRPRSLKVLNVQQEDVASLTLFIRFADGANSSVPDVLGLGVQVCPARSSLGLLRCSIARVSTIQRWLSLTGCKSDGQLVVDGLLLLLIGEGGQTGAAGPDSIWAPVVWASLGRVGAGKQNMLASSQSCGEAKPNRENKRVQTAPASNWGEK